MFSCCCSSSCYFIFVRSVLYELKSYESAIALTPIQLPPRSKVMEVAVSSTHIIAVTTGVVVLIYMTLLTGLKSLKVCAGKFRQISLREMQSGQMLKGIQETVV